MAWKQRPVECPDTRPSLLIRVKDTADALAWEEFVNAYAPVIFGFCRWRGLQEADAADVTQEVLKSVAAAIRGFTYQPERGQFRSWLFTVTRNEVNDLLTRQSRTSAMERSPDLLEQVPGFSPAEQENRWQQDYHQQLFDWAAKRIEAEVQPQTWAAFWQTAVLGRDTEEVAAELGLKPASVYAARSRILARFRAAIGELGEQSLDWL